MQLRFLYAVAKKKKKKKKNAVTIWISKRSCVQTFITKAYGIEIKNSYV